MKIYYKCTSKGLAAMAPFGSTSADMSPDGSFGITTLMGEIDPLPEGVEIISQEEAQQLVHADTWQNKVVSDLAVESDVDYSELRVSELRELCQERGIEGYSSMRKAQLIEALEG